MENKSLTIQAIKKLGSMNYEQKFRLFLRAIIMNQNSQIAGLLSHTMGIYDLKDFKSEIVHHLYDGNDEYNYYVKHNELLSAMNDKDNIYDRFDTYTLAGFVLYYSNFMEEAKDATDIRDLRWAKDNACKKTLQIIDRDKLNLSYNNELKIDSMTKREYRKSLLEYLKKDLKIKNINDAIIDFANEDAQYEEMLKDYYESLPFFESGKIYANQVEEYKTNDGKVMYLDPEGNIIDYLDIEDYVYNGYILRATSSGLIETKSKEMEF